MIKHLLSALGILLFSHSGLFAQVKKDYALPPTPIRLNQIGYYPKSQKIALVIGGDTLGKKFSIVTEDGKDTVFRGNLVNAGVWQYSEEMVNQADFSSLTKPGSYVLYVPKAGLSYPFDIKPHVYLPVAKASLKGFYYQRASTELLPEHAGKFARKAGHMDTAVLVHPSAATATRPADTKINCTKGWYDAGDYNKYIINSGISTYTLMALYEHFPKFMDTLNVNIPESKNQIPDVLDEALWNIRWIMSMQDEDGGVYFKLTNSGFDGSVMPERATSPRYVIQKTTASALDFCAVMAQASRVFAKYKKQMPGFSDSCLTMAKKAYAWAKKNPNILYSQKAMNDQFDPNVETGEYGDSNISDEFQWAAIELFAATGKMDYYEEANLPGTLNTKFGLPSWPDVNTLGLYTLISLKSKYPSLEGMDAVTEQIIKMATPMKEYAEKSPYKTTMGVDASNFGWGSNSASANQGMLLLIAYEITKDKSYLEAAMSCLDYLLGRNATGYSFMTGYGERSTFNPHHRPSESDGIKEPVPGLLAGGPNPGQQDSPSSCYNKYPSKLPAKSYVDHKCSYASNEIAINWNAPFAFLSLGIEAIKAGQK
ncbi:MAG: glycoside hydrolase family 9 protein [Cytophagaceae bacterium]